LYGAILFIFLKNSNDFVFPFQGASKIEMCMLALGNKKKEEEEDVFRYLPATRRLTIMIHSAGKTRGTPRI
jgi:hypothetical protein